MNELIRRPGGSHDVGQQRAATAARRDISGRSLTDSNWDGRVLDLSDAGLSVDIDAAVASAVVDEAGVRRRPDGTYYRLRIGWVAYPRTILVSRCTQELRRGADAKLHTIGPYVAASPNRYDSTAPAAHRRGVVPPDPPLAPGSPGGDAPLAGSEERKLRRTYEQGYAALAFLPSKVRRGVLARLQSPLLFTGQAIRFHDGDRYEVTLLGIHAMGAVVVSATTHRDTTSWNTDQYVYDWPADRGQLAAETFGRPTLPQA